MARSTKFLVACIALLCVSSWQQVRAGDAADDDEYADAYRAHLLIHKAIVEKSDGQLAHPIVVQGRNATITITLHNTGTGSAGSVVLSDVLPPNAQLVDGTLTATFTSIASGSVAKHTYVVVFTSGGSMDVAFLPAATVTYKAEEDTEQSATSTKPGVFVLTPVQQITRYALIAGTYASLGICRSPSDWRNMAVILLLVGGLVGANWGAKQFRSRSTATRRSRALRELEKDE